MQEDVSFFLFFKLFLRLPANNPKDKMTSVKFVHRSDQKTTHQT